MLNILNISRNNENVKSTMLAAWDVTPASLADEFSRPTIGTKDGAYFVRCAGTERTNNGTAQTAGVLILDGDSRITEDGEVIGGAPDPQAVHVVLASLNVSHIIYSSYSNAENFHKYRVIIPIEYSRNQLPVLLDSIHDKLHKAGVMLFNVPENRSWAQAWYFPRVPDEDHLKLFKCYSFLDGKHLDASAICSKHRPAAEPRPKPPESARIRAATEYVNPIEAFNNHFKSPVNYLLAQGYRAKGSKLIHPNSTSGVAGVQVCRNCTDGLERVYSHNGNDPLNDGYSHDAFDCYRLIEHNGDFNSALKAIGRIFLVNGITLERANRVIFSRRITNGS